MQQTVVDIRELSRVFGHKNALDSVSFRASVGLVYGLVGANGAGKTTMIKHRLGLLRPQTGSVRVFGLDPVRDPVGVLSRVGYLSEDRELPEWMRIDELMRIRRIPSATAAMSSACARMPLGEVLDPFGRVELAIAIISAVALGASFLPAHRASRVAPMEALREQ